MEPLIEKLEDLKEEVAIAAAIPQPNRVAIEGETPAAFPASSILIADPNYGFTEEELGKLKVYGLPSPLEAFNSGEEISARKRAANINKKSRWTKTATQRGFAKARKTGRGDQ